MLDDLAKALGLKVKPNTSLSVVLSVTGDTINSATLNFEGASDESELVFKNFDTVGGIMDSAKGMARAGGFPTNAEEWGAQQVKAGPKSRKK